MRLKLLIRDVDYLRAFVDTVSKLDSDIYVEIGRDATASADTLIVTDLEAKDFGISLIRELHGGIVFLTEVETTPIPDEEGPFSLFKYRRLSDLISDLRLCYFVHTGEMMKRRSRCRRLCVCGDFEPKKATAFADRLARQILYRAGGAVLLCPLSFLDGSAEWRNADAASFKRMMYYIETKRSFPTEVFFQRDSYGIFRFRNTGILNPIAFLTREERGALIERLSADCFDTIVFDLGECYTDANVEILREADRAFWVGGGGEASVRLMEEISGSDLTEVTFLDAEKHLDELELSADDEAKKLCAAG